MSGSRQQLCGPGLDHGDEREVEADARPGDSDHLGIRIGEFRYVVGDDMPAYCQVSTAKRGGGISDARRHRSAGARTHSVGP